MQVMDILVRLSLVKAKGYPQVQLQAVQLLTPDQRGLVAHYAAALTPLFAARPEAAEDGAAPASGTRWDRRFPLLNKDTSVMLHA